MRLKSVLWILVGLILLLLALPWMIPTATYKTQIEKLASEKINAPVTIEALHFALLPTPRANLSGLRVGAHEEIAIKDVGAVLDVTTVFSPVRALSRLVIEQPVIKDQAVGLITPLLSETGDGSAQFTIRQIQVNKAKLLWPSLTLPLLNVVASMEEAGGLRQATISDIDGKMNIDLLPQGKGYRANVSASQWIPPVGPPLKIDKLTAQLDYQDKTLDVPSLEADLYQGKLKASAKLDWLKDWRLKGKLSTSAVELKDLTKVFSKSVTVSGRLSGQGDFSSMAKKPDELAEKLVLDYKFNVAKGVLHGMDLAKAASLFVKQSGQNGETEFDEFYGKVHLAGKQIDLKEMKVTSGLLGASGNVRVTPSKALKGDVEVELKKGLALVSVPLKVSGTVDAPEVMPTKAAIAGAAAGTAVLGPLGTSVGMKAGAALDRLFGDKK